MTLIDIRRTADLLQSFEEIYHQMEQFYIEVEESNVSLGNLSGMQQVRKKIETILEDIQDEAGLAEKFSDCLEGTCQNFARYENEIIVYAEETERAGSGGQILGRIEIPENILNMLR